MITKKFDQTEFDNNDERARRKLISWFASKNITAKDNDDPYGPDLHVFKEGVFMMFAEVEIKRVWLEDFQYPDINFPERKGKFAVMPYPTYFFMFNANLTKMFVVSNIVLRESPLEIVPNRHVTTGERFYKVPVSKAKLVNLT